MKKWMKLFLSVVAFTFFSFELVAQDFTVEKISGKVLVLQGSEEIYHPVKIGQRLSGTDVIVTDINSMIQLNKNGSRFLLKSDAALGLNYIKAISINDLLLALTMEEVKSIPKTNLGQSKNTAVYGTEIGIDKGLINEDIEFGTKRLNGARQLAENGFKESAVLVAKETYRKYPSTKSRVEERIYFADVLLELGLKREALTDYIEIKSLSPGNKAVEKRIEEVSLALTNEK